MIHFSNFVIFLIGFISCYVYFIYVLKINEERYDLSFKVTSLLKNSRQWLDASWEDEDFINSFSHACTSKTLLDAARTLMTDKDIADIYPKFDKLLEKSQRQFKTISKNLLSKLGDQNQKAPS